MTSTDNTDEKISNHNDCEEDSKSAEKSATEEVSEILTNLPKTASGSFKAGKQWSRINVKSSRGNSNKIQGDNSSPDESTSCSDNDDESEAESSDLDEETSSTLRDHCMVEMSVIEKQLIELRDLLKNERLTQINKKLKELHDGTAVEYLQQLHDLQQQKEVKLQVSEILKSLRIESLETWLKAEKLANSQHLNNEKKILKGKINEDFMEKIRRLEEDRNDVDIEYWPDHNTGFGSRPTKGKRKKKEDFSSYSFGSLRRKKKPVTVTGPYIVYMLKDADILDDWTAIRKAANASNRTFSCRAMKKRHFNHCRYEDGKLYFSGKMFVKGQNIVIKGRMHNETKFVGTIENLSPTEIRIQQNNGKKLKLYVHQLQRGKFAIHHR